MGNANEPRLMKPRREETRVYDNATGDAGRDGYTRIARREVPGRHQGSDDGMNPVPYGNSDTVNPQVGERDYNRGPRFSEDY